MTLLAPKLAAAKAVGALARRSGRGGGTSLPGKVLMRVEPHAIGLLARRLTHGNVVISATNGKTTTAAMVAAILERQGHDLVHNRAGANMAGGVASALAAASRRGGRSLTGDLGLFEVDEFWLGDVVEELRPRALLLANLFRDQLDRYGELDTIADRWAAVVARRAGDTRLVLNADDPLVADLARAVGGPGADADAPPTATDLGDRRTPLHFGVEDDALAQAELQHASDSKHCRRCGHAYAYEVAYLGHLGRYACPNCGARRPTPAITAHAVELRGIRAAAFTLRTPAGEARVELPLPGLYNVYNALGAAALTLSMGVALPDVVAGLQAVEPAFGRAETVVLGGRPTSILLVKNPAGANEVLRTLSLEGGELDLFGVLNDRTADGRDVSWVWDADWELLVPHVRRMVCSGTRGAELALRMKYAGVDPERLEVVEPLAEGLDRALAGAEAPAPLYALPTYTALLELQALLSERGAAREYWR
ncbi:MAG: proposed amino acid ligase found clustered with an amidotransferase [uncultured Solirubrobacteraceae bacterium]|uniref:Lipid II isoglutaminyl synthase (glutamine-hydrolyzing) subunit MurT n=1 Tax=uncultured Solirubrobacteraceae bacterium TaxID=1162706 RepID=A0A6J4TKJ4_9ACTN|nr:MAG: proposed amino acid ligase found clustered with an amidotransferase [uncultured Solirubrobacteraceae bacterium]